MSLLIFELYLCVDQPVVTFYLHIKQIKRNVMSLHLMLVWWPRLTSLWQKMKDGEENCKNALEKNFKVHFYVFFLITLFLQSKLPVAFLYK